MIEWGLSFGSHDSGIAVFDNDQLVFATEGERWSGIKHDKYLPPNLIKYVTDTYGEPQEIYYFEDWKIKEHRRKVAGQPPKAKPRMIAGKHYNDWNISGHHLSHCAYGYYTSPYDDCTTIVVDSIGEWDTMSIWRCAGGSVSKTYSWHYPQSLGLMYTAATLAGGWNGNDEEFKMMGASAFGKGQKEYNILKELWDSGFNFHKGWNYEGDDQFEIAAGAQRLFEKWMKLLTKYVQGPLVLVGGCAMNSKMNGKFKQDLYVPPAPTDAGSAVGCVLAHKKKKIKMDGFHGYNIDKEPNIKFILEELKEGAVVGVAHGKAEFGPRALGNRSILADPFRDGWKTALNRIKNREPWRPYGVMVREDDMGHFFHRPRKSPYMNVCFKAKESVPKDLVHHDGTVRVQTIDKDHTLWDIFDEFPLVVNTSLNVKGKPIVNNEKDVMEMRNASNLIIL